MTTSMTTNMSASSLPKPFPKAEIIRLLRKRGHQEAARRLYRIKCKPMIIPKGTPDSVAVGYFIKFAFDWSTAEPATFVRRFDFWADLYTRIR